MNTYEVTVSLTCTYTIHAPTQEQAEEIACDYFWDGEAIPDVQTMQVQTD